MSVEVLHAASIGDSQGGESPEGSRSVRGLANGLYNMFLADAPASAALPAPMVPAAVLPGAPSLGASPTGCAVRGVTKTVLVYAGINGKHTRLIAALDRTRDLAALAAGRGNVVHYVFLGGALPPHGAADEGVAEWLVALATKGSSERDISAANVHLIAGPREIQAMSLVAGGMASEATTQYLLASKLIECLGPESMDERGTGGMWLKCTSTQGGAIVGKLPGVGVMGADGPRAEWIESPTPLTPIAWKDELNRRWRAVAKNPKALRDASGDKWQFWMTLGVQSALDDELLPAAGLDTTGCKSLAVFARQTAAFGTVRRTLHVDKRSLLMVPGECWLDVGVSSDSLYWAVKTWCYSTMKAMNAHKLPMLDRTPNLSELQYDVNCTLSSLVQHSERSNALTPPVHPWANFGKLRGQLGPCVCAGREGQEILRVVQWAGNGMPDVIMLLPEQYVRYVLRDYFQDLVGLVELGARVVSGFLVLEDENIVAMRVPDVSEAEQLHANEAMGARLWKLPLANKGTDEAIKDIKAAPPAWRNLLKYTVPGVSEPSLVPGQRLDSATGRHIFYTHTTSADPLSGLYVKWVFAPGEAVDARDMPTLDLANGDFETVL